MKWEPFYQTTFKPQSLFQQQQLAAHAGISVEEYQAMMAKDQSMARVFMNNIYQVVARKIAPKDGEDGGPLWPSMIYLSIKRLDKEPIGKTKYRDFMRIKDELLGPEFEMVELYPARSREVDEANQYHCWALPSNEVRFPFGFQERYVSCEPKGGSKQAAFKPEHAKVLNGGHYG